MDSSPKVSIVIPVYNAERTITRCVESVLGQEYSDFELILVDDGSTDGTPAMLDSFAERDSRVRVEHKEPSGVSNTRNRGIELARGSYIQFLDADDWITTDATKLLVRAMEAHDCDMVIADFYRVIGERVSRKGDIPADLDRPISREEYADFMLENPADFYWGVLWNKLFRRSIMDEYDIRMDPDISWSEDFIFNMEYVLHAKAIYPLHAPVYYYVKTEGSLVDGNGMVATAKMKANVIRYYRNFYKQLYDKKDYAERRMSVYRFLFDLADDGGANRVMPSTKKLGEELGVEPVQPVMASNALSDAFYAQTLLDRYLGSVGQRFDLSLAEVRAFAYVRYAGVVRTREEIGTFAGISGMSLASALGRLQSRDLIVTEHVSKETGPARPVSTAPVRRSTIAIRLSDGAAELERAVDQALSDFDGVCAKGLDASQKAVAITLEGHVASNVREALKAV